MAIIELVDNDNIQKLEIFFIRIGSSHSGSSQETKKDMVVPNYIQTHVKAVRGENIHASHSRYKSCIT